MDVLNMYLVEKERGCRSYEGFIIESTLYMKEIYKVNRMNLGDFDIYVLYMHMRVLSQMLCFKCCDDMIQLFENVNLVEFACGSRI